MRGSVICVDVLMFRPVNVQNFLAPVILIEVEDALAGA